jgi:hypothetical protein
MTFKDGQVVELTRYGPKNENIPTLVEKIHNFEDVNRFRISRMWIENFFI